MTAGPAILHAQPKGRSVAGTLSAQLDSKRGIVTAVFVGNSEGATVVVGPRSWDMTGEEFSRATAMDIGKRLLGAGCTVRQVTKSTNSGKEIIAGVIIVNWEVPRVGR